MRLFGGREGCEKEKGHIYKMHEKLISIRDDYWIEDETGERALFIDEKALRIRNTLILKICGKRPLLNYGKTTPDQGYNG